LHPDILELARFYKSPLGRMTRDILRGQVQAHWDPSLPRSMLGLGYALPYLWPYLGDERVGGGHAGRPRGAPLAPSRPIGHMPGS